LKGVPRCTQQITAPGKSVLQGASQIRCSCTNCSVFSLFNVHLGEEVVDGEKNLMTLML